MNLMSMFQRFSPSLDTRISWRRDLQSSTVHQVTFGAVATNHVIRSQGGSLNSRRRSCNYLGLAWRDRHPSIGRDLKHPWEDIARPFHVLVKNFLTKHTAASNKVATYVLPTGLCKLTWIWAAEEAWTSYAKLMKKRISHIWEGIAKVIQGFIYHRRKNHGLAWKLPVSNRLIGGARPTAAASSNYVSQISLIILHPLPKVTAHTSLYGKPAEGTQNQYHLTRVWHLLYRTDVKDMHFGMWIWCLDKLWDTFGGEDFCWGSKRQRGCEANWKSCSSHKQTKRAALKREKESRWLFIQNTSSPFSIRNKEGKREEEKEREKEF